MSDERNFHVICGSFFISGLFIGQIIVNRIKTDVLCMFGHSKYLFDDLKIVIYMRFIYVL